MIFILWIKPTNDLPVEDPVVVVKVEHYLAASVDPIAATVDVSRTLSVEVAE